MTVLEWLSLGFAAICIYRMVDTMGKKINIPESIAAITSIIYLVMPVVTYNVFDEHNRLAALWRTFMPIASDEYFRYALPGMMALVFGLLWPLNKPHGLTDKELIERVKTYLVNKEFIGSLFIFLGLIFGLVLPWMPENLRAIAYFANQLIFVGVFYLLYSPIKFKGIILVSTLLILFLQSINTGMYGELIFWSFFILIYLLMSMKRLSFGFKTIMVCLGILAIIFIQSIKHEYREKTWGRGERQGDAGFFISLVMERLRQPSTIFEAERMHAMASRGNQGFLLARTLDYVPDKEPFAKGETVVQAVSASLIPRIFWKNKPELGGEVNTCRFLGDCGKRNYSYNIGQLGEAYVNFGPIGGVVFIFFYGLFINWGLHQTKKLAVHTPSIILWIPLIFFASMSMETDVLTFLNTMVKGILFSLLIYFGFRFTFQWKI